MSASQRLPSDTFRLPVGRIRSGWYSDAYFVATRDLLIGEDHHPEVLMQVFQKKDAILGGIDEAIAVLRECADAGRSSRSTRCTRVTRSAHASPS